MAQRKVHLYDMGFAACGKTGSNVSLSDSACTVTCEKCLDIADQWDSDNVPAEGDFTMTPCGPLGGKVALAVVGGRFIGEFDDQEQASEVARAIMEAEKFWPNLWWVSDHGNVSLAQ